MRKKLKSDSFNSYVAKTFLKTTLGVILFIVVVIAVIFVVVKFVPENKQHLFILPGILIALAVIIVSLVRYNRKSIKKNAELEQEFIDGKISDKEHTKIKTDKLKLMEIAGKGLIIVTILKMILKLLTD